MKKIVSLFLLITFLLAPSLHYASEKPITQTIAIYTEHYPPFNMKVNKKLTGLSVDILSAMFKEMNSTQSILDIRLTNWSRAYNLALKKPNSMVFSTNRARSREKLFKWVGPITNTKVGIIALKSKNIVINKIEDLNNYKIGAVLKDVGELLLLDRGIDKKHIFHVEGENAINLSFNKMQKNRIDLFSYDITVAFANARLIGFDISQYEVVYTLQESGIYFAFNKNTDDEIINQWQQALNNIKEKGIHAKILAYY